MEGLAKRLDEFDHRRFGTVCRQIVICCLNDRYDAAREALNDYLRPMNLQRVGMSAAVHVAFPLRVANDLFDAGYRTLDAVHRADDAELQALPGFGDVKLELVRDTIRAASTGQLLERGDDDADDLVDHTYQVPALVEALKETLNNHSGATMQESAQQPTALDSAIDTLLKADDAAVAAIDAKIDALQAQIAKLRTARKLLGGKITSGIQLQVRKEDEGLLEEIIAFIREHGSAKASVISEGLSTDDRNVGYITVGRLASASDKLDRRGGKIVLAGE